MKVDLGWLRCQLKKLAPLYDRLSTLQSEHQHGVVYAIRFERQDLHCFRGGHDTIICDGSIAPERIVAKAHIYGSLKRLRRTDRCYPVIALDENTFPGALLKQESERDRKASTEISPDLWQEAGCDPFAGEDLVGSADSATVKARLTAVYPKFLLNGD